jgi:hypothetical protein
LQRNRSRRVWRTQISFDAIDPLAAAGRVLNHDVAPLRADDTLDRDLVCGEVLPSVSLRSPNRGQRIEQRAMRPVVRSEVEGGK